jgi:hypothetical protein
MVDKEFRKALEALAKDRDVEVIILDNHAYDKSIIGITDDGRLVYSFDKMVEEYVEDEGVDDIQAMEWLEYNTIQSLPYMGVHAPIVIVNDREGIIFRYGN